MSRFFVVILSVFLSQVCFADLVLRKKPSVPVVEVIPAPVLAPTVDTADTGAFENSPKAASRPTAPAGGWSGTEPVPSRARRTVIAAPVATVAVSAPVAAMPSGVVTGATENATSVSSEQIYSLNGGDTLRESLERWATDSSWGFEWKPVFDVPVAYSFTYPPGTSFDDAVTKTMKSLWFRPPGAKGPQALVATFYTDHRVLVISPKQ